MVAPLPCEAREIDKRIFLWREVPWNAMPQPVQKVSLISAQGRFVFLSTPQAIRERLAGLSYRRGLRSSGGLDTIRDSRIAFKMGFGTLPYHVRHQRFAAGAFPRRLRSWRERNNLSQSEAALKLQISKRTLQEWEQGRAAPRGFARTAIEKAIRG